MPTQIVPDLETAEADVKAAKARRTQARTLAAEAYNAELMASAAAEHERWADPALTAAVADARRVLSLAEAERDALVTQLRGKHADQSRRRAQTATANKVPYDRPLEGVDAIGSLVIEDPVYLAAEDIVRLARTDLRKAQRVAQRSAQMRKYEAGVLAREERLTAATPRGALDRLAGQPTKTEMIEREQALMRLVRKDGAS